MPRSSATVPVVSWNAAAPFRPSLGPKGHSSIAIIYSTVFNTTRICGLQKIIHFKLKNNCHQIMPTKYIMSLPKHCKLFSPVQPLVSVHISDCVMTSAESHSRVLHPSPHLSLVMQGCQSFQVCVPEVFLSQSFSPQSVHSSLPGPTIVSDPSLSSLTVPINDKFGKVSWRKTT